MSLIAKAGKLSGHTGAVKHWSHGWYTTSKNGEDNNSQGNYGFQFKRWQRVVADDSGNVGTRTNKLIDDEDVYDYFDLNSFDRFKKVDQLKKSQSGTTTTASRTAGLTVDDIRGAVGGVDAIPGFSSSDAISKKEAEGKQDDTISEKAIEATTGGENKGQDADGDLKMD